MSRFYRRWRVFALVGTATTGIVVHSAVLAEPAPPFAQLLERTADAPRIEVLDADVARAEGLARQAEARPNPTVSVMAENFAGGAPYGGYQRAETTVQYNQPLEIGGKRSARIASGEAGVSAARARSHAGRVQYAYELALAYADVEIADRRIALALGEIEEAREDLRIASELVKAGKESRLRQIQAETEVDRLTAELESARAIRTGALARLTALAGASEPYTGISESLLGRLGAPATMGPPDPMANPAWRVAAAESTAAGARVTAEQRRANPDITIHLGTRRLEGDAATAFVAGVTVPLNLFDRNRGNIAAAEADLRAAEARAEAARLDAQAALETARANVVAADAQVLASGRGLGNAEEAHRLARIAYQAGKVPLSEVLTARLGVGAARARLLDAETVRFRTIAVLAALNGYSIAGDQIP